MCFNLSLNKASSDTAGLASLVPGKGKTPLRASWRGRVAAQGPGDMGQGCPEGQGLSLTLLFEEGSKEQGGHLGFEKHLFPHPPSIAFLLYKKRDSAVVCCVCREMAPWDCRPPAPLANPPSLKSRRQPEVSHGRSFSHRAGHQTLHTPLPLHPDW